MRYDKIKKHVADRVGTQIRHLQWGEANAAALLDAVAEKRSARQSLAELEKLVRRIILGWDVRMVGKLRDLFPGCFPSSLRTGPLLAALSDAGEWEVVRDNRRHLTRPMICGEA